MFPNSNSTKFTFRIQYGNSNQPKQKHKADMAEWFKAADLRPAIIDAWVRTPLSAKENCSQKRNHPKPFFMISSES